MSPFQIISVHLSLPLFNFTQWKDKCATYSFTTKTLTHSKCQVSLVVEYISKGRIYVKLFYAVIKIAMNMINVSSNVAKK